MPPHMGSVPSIMAGSTGSTLSMAARYHALARITVRAITSASSAHSRYSAAGYLSTRSQIPGPIPDRVQPSFTLSHRRRQARPPAASRARAAQAPRRHASSAAEAAEAATQQAITAPRSGWGPKA